MTATVQLPRSVARSIRKLLGGGQRGHIDDCHPKQLALVQDPRKRIAVQGGRRGGKSQALGRRLLAACDKHPGETACYVTLTRGRARDILWDKCLARLNRKHGLGLKLVQREDLFIECPNGSRIWLVGVNDKGDVDKLRGGFFSEVVVDEAMAMPEYLKELVEEAIAPALMDLRGALVIAGTPCPVMAGYFWEATTGGNPDVAQWPVHSFTILDNPYLPHGAEDLAQALKDNYGGDATHPTYRREWLGEWVEDLGALVYPFTYAGNAWEPTGDSNFGLPPGDYTFGLGVDVGFSERSTAFTLAARRNGTGQLYLIRSWTRSRLIPTALAAACQAIREEVAKVTKDADPLGNPKGLTIVVDEGALGKGFAEQMRDMGVGCEAAEKSEKRAYQEYVGGLIRSSSPPYRKQSPCPHCRGDGEDGCSMCGGDGVIATGAWEGGFGVLVNFRECAELIEEARKLQFDEETGKESELYRRHCGDSFLYLARKLMPAYRPQESEPEPGTPEAVNRDMAKRKADLIKQRQKGRVSKYG
jgi:hypothetical protein